MQSDEITPASDIGMVTPEGAAEPAGSLVAPRRRSRGRRHVATEAPHGDPEPFVAASPANTVSEFAPASSHLQSPSRPAVPDGDRARPDEPGIQSLNDTPAAPTPDAPEEHAESEQASRGRRRRPRRSGPLDVDSTGAQEGAAADGAAREREQQVADHQGVDDIHLETIVGEASDERQQAFGAQRHTGASIRLQDGQEPVPEGGFSPARDARASDRGARHDSRGRRDWREQTDGRDVRDGQRFTPRDRQQPGRDRGFSNQRDSRFGAPPGHPGTREGQPHRDQQRENGSYRDAGGYRDGSVREPQGRERRDERLEATPQAQQRDRHVDAAPVRPVEVVTRGYVISVDQNQSQWQLRVQGHLPSPNDAMIPGSVVRANGLRVGDEIVGLVRAAAPGRRFGELLDVQSINGISLEQIGQRPRFDDLTPIYPDRHMRLERPESVTARLIDLISPIGFGQRALIVSPPKAGKTTILKEIGRSINVNYPEVKLIVCLVGERPEEVTDLAKSLEAELISSTFDEAIAHHTELAEITAERARRLVESGFDVVILLDSITRLARAYNLAAPGDSRSLSGGMATSALYPPKRFFGAARAFQEGGSLTVIATCLVDTNSRLDDVIYEELKGTGNMELVLDRRLAEERVFPAIDIVKSSTRREELLLQPNELTAVMRVRRAMAMAGDLVGSTRNIIQQMERTRTNAEFLASLLSQSAGR